MAVICDYCPHEVDGKFSLNQAELAIFLVRNEGDHYTDAAACCPGHLQDCIDDKAADTYDANPGAEAMLSIRRANDYKEKAR